MFLRERLARDSSRGANECRQFTLDRLGSLVDLEMVEVFLQEHSQDMASVLRNWLSGTLAGCWTSCSVETWKICSCRNTSSICTWRDVGQNVKREKCSCRNIVENFRRCVAFCNTSKATSHFQYFVSNTWCIIS